MKKVYFILVACILFSCAEKQPTQEIIQSVNMGVTSDIYDYAYGCMRCYKASLEDLEKPRVSPTFELITRIIVAENDTIDYTKDYGTAKEIQKLKCQRYYEAKAELQALKLIRNLNCK
jgi:hypothetical protein